MFEAGLLKLKCHFVSLGQPGGQLTEIYPKKPIYDIPGYPSVLASELVDNLIKQIEPFKPEFTLGERAEILEKQKIIYSNLPPAKALQYTHPWLQ